MNGRLCSPVLLLHAFRVCSSPSESICKKQKRGHTDEPVDIQIVFILLLLFISCIWSREKRLLYFIDYCFFFFFGQLAREQCALKINFKRTKTSQRALKTSVICKHIKCNVSGGGRKVSVVSKKCNDTK